MNYKSSLKPSYELIIFMYQDLLILLDINLTVILKIPKNIVKKWQEASENL